MKNTQIFSIALGLLMPILSTAQLQSRLDYIDSYKHIAIAEMQRTGIPASIKMAQAILESGAGTSTLSHQAKNHFGIKCSNKWTGDTYYHKDDDYKNGKLIESCFRKYENPSESFMAHSEFLQVNNRYKFLFELDPSDYHGWAKGLKKAGYATAKTYDKRLIKLIEDYELYQLDMGIYPDRDMIASADPVFTPPSTPVTTKPNSAATQNYPTRIEADKNESDYTAGLNVKLLNHVKSVIARPGDTPERMAAVVHVSASRLVRYNEGLKNSRQSLKGGERIFLQPKRASYRGKKKYHYVKAGETMFDISQIYGIRLVKLYERNRLNPGYEPATGSKVKIKGGKIKSNDRPRNSFRGNRSPIEVDDFEWENENETDLTASTSANTYSSPTAPAKRPVTNSTTKPASRPAQSASSKHTTTASTTTTYSRINTATYTTETATPNAASTRIIEQPITQSTIPTTIHEPTTQASRPSTSVPSPVIEINKPVKPNNPPLSTSGRVILPVKYHVVAKSETLYRISKTFGVRIEDIRTLNDLSGNTIHVGQKLRVQ